MSMTGVRRTQRRLVRARARSPIRVSIRGAGPAADCSISADVRRIFRFATTTVALGCLLLGTQASPAQAGTYDTWNCSVPGQPSSLLQPWVATEWLVPNVAIVDACATGGGWGFSLSGTR